MSGGDPHGLNPWVDARGPSPQPPDVPHPRGPLEDQSGVRLLGPPVRVRRGPRLSFLLVVAFVVTAIVVLGGRWWASASAALAPPAGVEESLLPLGAPPLESALATGNHAFTAMQPDGSGPVAYSPCRPIHFVVRAQGAPPNGTELIRTAIGRVSAATGLQFVDDGLTQEAPSADRDAYQPQAYGRRWAPVLVAWSDPTETPALAGDIAGIGGSAAVTRAGSSVYVTGAVTLDAPAIVQMSASANGAAVAYGVVTHEFGHLVGLDHVDDPTQLMNPRSSISVTSFASGDLAGLAALGTGSCAPGV